MKRRAWLFTLLAAVSAVLGVLSSGCGTSSARSSSGGGDESRAVASAGEASVRAGPVEDLFLMTGELRAVHSLDLVTPRSESWQVQIKWLADDGSVLHEGDRAIEFDNSQILQTIEEKK